MYKMVYSQSNTYRWNENVFTVIRFLHRMFHGVFSSELPGSMLIDCAKNAAHLIIIRLFFKTISPFPTASMSRFFFLMRQRAAISLAAGLRWVCRRPPVDS